MKYFLVHVNYDGERKDEYVFYSREKAEEFRRAITEDLDVKECYVISCENSHYDKCMSELLEYVKDDADLNS